MANLYSVNVAPDLDALDRFAEQASKSWRLMLSASARATLPIRNEMVAELSRVPAPWPPGIKRRWTSPKQRRAFYVTNGFGRGIPTTRTGALARGWKTRMIRDSSGRGAQFSLSNDTEYMPFVQGDFVQIMHLDTGWPQRDEVIAKYGQRLDNVMVDTWFSISNPFAGVRG